MMHAQVMKNEIFTGRRITTLDVINKRTTFLTGQLFWNKIIMSHRTLNLYRRITTGLSYITKLYGTFIR